MREKVELVTLISIFMLSLVGVSPNVYADEIVHQFKNPSFSGIGTGAHYLTIENQEHSRQKSIEEALEAAAKAAQRAEENTTLAKFIRNLESRIYAQLSKQLVDNMFGNEEGSLAGSFTLEGNTINYVRMEQCGEDGVCIEVIQMTIIDAEGSETIITIPIGTGGF